MMARWRPAALRFALTLALLSTAAAEVGAEESKPAARYADELASCYTVMVSAERLIVLGPYGQEGSEGEGGMTLAAMGYMHTQEATSDPFLPHTVPRLAVDVVVGTQVTVGAAAGVGLSHAERAGYEYSSSGSSERPTSSATTAIVAGRVGFIAPVRKGLALWPRVGLSGAWSNNERERSNGSTVDDETTSTTLNLEMVLAFAVSSHVALSLDFAADLALRGSSDVDDGYASEPTEARRMHDGFSVSFGVVTFY